MRLLTIDFETYWSETHTLSKMSPMAYVTHPETEVISAAYKIDNQPTEVIFGEDTIRTTLRVMNLGEFMVVGHNMSGFDAMILAWRFGIRPKMWGCTLAMAKPIHAITVGGSLAKLVQHYNLGTKNQAVLHQTRGRHLKDFTRQELKDMARYNAEDVDQCYGLFQKLKPHYTAKELWHIDATIRMLVEPKFVLDYDKLERSLMGERDNKRKQLIQLSRMLGINWLTEDAESKGEAMVEAEVAAVLASAPKFSSLLEAQGVPTPMKASPTNPDKQVPALAKTDEEFLKLQEHPNEIVAAAARARLSVKSTLLETRIEKFIEAADACEGLLPVPLHYCGATTTGRWSGWHMNLQNLPRIPRDKQGQIVPKLTNALRLSMRAPAGHKVVVADLSGIELRVNHFLWQVPSSMELYQSDPKADLYRAFAAARYGIKPEHVTKDQRQLAKVAQLGLGFGAGYKTFMKVAKLMGGLDLLESESREIVEAWRSQYRAIVDGWATCHAALTDIYEGRQAVIDPWGLCHTTAEGIRLPSGRLIRYPSLRQQPDPKGDRMEWVYGEGRHTARIYSGKIDENVVQALARDVIADNAVDFFKATKLRPSLMVHDELVYIVPEAQAQDALDTLQAIMRTPPKWWPGLVTWSEGDIADSYGDAK